ncbi:MAG TPA: phage integrase N-terminal SAM-like domain-containing protein [bacterium]|nr:phage integrase N-terminal SAM-like domain-containing protein [bacterium]
MPSVPRTTPQLVDAFLLQKQVGGCSARTMGTYRWWLDRIAADMSTVADLDTLGITTYLAKLPARGMKPSTVHQAYRALRTFIRWLLMMGLLKTNPLAPITWAASTTRSRSTNLRRNRSSDSLIGCSHFTRT